MNNEITRGEYELISAYLDNQLGDRDRASFEERLKTSPELRKELQEIGQTRLLLRSLPRLRAPHNYYIQVKAAQPRPTLRLAPVFGIVSAIASVLLAFVIFGSTFFSSSTQVALSPVVPTANAPLAVQQEVVKQAPASDVPTEAAPSVLMGAQIQATPTPEAVGALKIGQNAAATPTTIYIYVYPPTSTPEGEFSNQNEATGLALTPCEVYYETGEYPPGLTPGDCPTLTSTSPLFLQSLPITVTIDTETPTPTATATPTPTPTSTPTYSPTPSPTESPSPADNLASQSSEAGPTEGATSVEVVGAGNPTAADRQTTETEQVPNVSFLNYLVLTVEISLSAIAVIAGIIAIFLRIRAR